MVPDSKLCISCLQQEDNISIFEPHKCEIGELETSATILKNCFDIEISPDCGLNSMCKTCILKLRVAYYFKLRIVKNTNEIARKSNSGVRLSGADSFTNIEFDYETNSNFKFNKNNGCVKQYVNKHVKKKDNVQNKVSNVQTTENDMTVLKIGMNGHNSDETKVINEVIIKDIPNSPKKSQITILKVENIGSFDRLPQNINVLDEDKNVHKHDTDKVININNNNINAFNNEPSVHNDVNVLNKDISIHNKGTDVHSKDISIHSMDKNVPKKVINVNNDQSMYNEVVNMHNEDVNIQNEDINVHNEGKNVHTEDIIVHKEDISVQNEDSMKNIDKPCLVLKSILKRKLTNDINTCPKKKKSVTFSRYVIFKESQSTPRKPPIVLQSDQTICPTCFETFDKPQELFLHINLHYPNQVCEECGKTFASQKRLKRHMISHTTGYFPCSICNQIFVKQNTLTSHIWRVHRTPTPYPCPACPARFTTRSQRLSHLRAAHGRTGTQYACQYCGRKYYDSGSRSQHIRFYHRGERPHHCTHCPRVFAKHSYLRSHLANAHDIGEKTHECRVCEKRFFRNTTLRYHMKTHDRAEKYKCAICAAGFAYKAVLICHLMTHDRDNAAMNYKTSETIVENVESDGQYFGNDKVAKDNGDKKSPKRDVTLEDGDTKNPKRDDTLDNDGDTKCPKRGHLFWGISI